MCDGVRSVTSRGNLAISQSKASVSPKKQHNTPTSSLGSSRNCLTRLPFYDPGIRHEADAALEVIEQGLSAASHNGERIFEAELYRLKARVLLVRGAPDARTEAQLLLDQALRSARSQQARSLELRTASDLAALWIGQGRRHEALDLLTSIYAWFTEGYAGLEGGEGFTRPVALRVRTHRLIQ
jgi:hypothetical protein